MSLSVTAVLPGADLPNPLDAIPNPFEILGGVAGAAGGNIATNVWTAAMLAIWNAGLFFFRLILNLMDAWLTPDLSSDGPARDIYGFTLWLAVALLVAFVIIQLGLAAVRRDGKGLARALIGVAQFVMVWAIWIGYAIILVTACGGLTEGLLKALFGGAKFSEIDLWRGFSTEAVTDSVVATVLGFLGIFLILASIVHLMVYLVRSASLIVLVATSQISAAGLAADFGKTWFWKTLRWVHAAAFAPVLMVLVLGVGSKMTEGVATGLSDSTQQAIGTAVPGVVLICMSAVCPFALFKLLAFVDPGTSSGAAMRQGLAAQGGIQGLLSGKTSAAGGGSAAASQTDGDGRSAGEDSAESSSDGRFAQAMRGGLGVLGNALGAAATIGAKGVAIGTDLNNLAGVGHQSHYPDFTGVGGGRRRGDNSNGRGSNSSDSDVPDDSDSGGDTNTQDLPSAEVVPGQVTKAFPSPSQPAANESQPPDSGASKSAPKGPSGGGAAGAGGAGEAAAVPVA